MQTAEREGAICSVNDEKSSERGGDYCCVSPLAPQSTRYPKFFDIIARTPQRIGHEEQAAWQ